MHQLLLLFWYVYINSNLRGKNLSWKIAYRLLLEVYDYIIPKDDILDDTDETESSTYTRLSFLKEYALLPTTIYNGSLYAIRMAFVKE